MRTKVFFILILCTAVTLCAQQRSDADTASKILALKNAWNRASENKDISGLDNLLDERFLYVDLNGRLMNKAEVLKDVQDSSVHQVVTLSIVVRLHGDAAIVTGLFQMKAIEHGQTLLQQGRFIDTWLRKGERWVAIGSLTTPTQ